jgi:NhaP-type Na+/H+ or K+/H+ antiporter
MLGLGLLGWHEIGAWAWRWWLVDVFWAVGAGFGIGAVLGTLTARLVLWLRREHKEGVGRDEFIALGLIALSYGAALLVHAYGFLAVFAAGVALRTVERRLSGDAAPADVLAMEHALPSEEIATDPEKAPAHMAGAVLAFNEQIERILEVALVLTIGVALSASHLLRSH